MSGVPLTRRLAELEHTISDLHRQIDARDERLKELEALVVQRRRKLPDERRSVTVKLRIGDRTLVRHCPTCEAPTPESPRITSLHLTIGFDSDGRISEWFIRMDRDWRVTMAGSFADEWAKNASLALQHGAQLNWILEKARHSRDDTAGVPYVWNLDHDRYEPHPIIHHVGSIVDYCAAIIERVRDKKPAWKAAPEEIVMCSEERP